MKCMTKCAKDCQTLAHRLGLGVEKKTKHRRQDESGADKDGDHLIGAERNYVVLKTTTPTER